MGGLAMKVMRSQWIVVTAACLIVASSMAQSGGDLPPGVDESDWIPISDAAGIVLTNVSGIPTIPRLPGDRVVIVPQLLRPGTGILMVKHGGAWMRLDLELPQPRVQPLL
jgi:hypothetical protein